MKKQYEEVLKTYNNLLDNYKITLQNLQESNFNLQDKILKLTEQKEELEKKLNFEDADKKVKIIREIQADLNINSNRINLINNLLSNPDLIENYTEIKNKLKSIANEYRIYLMNLNTKKADEIQAKRDEFEKSLEPFYQQKKDVWIEQTEVESMLRSL